MEGFVNIYEKISYVLRSSLIRRLALPVGLLCCFTVYPALAQAGRSAGMAARDSATLSRALAAYNSGNGAAAKPELERLAAKYPSSFAANEALGLLYVDAEDYARALPYLKRAADTSRGNAVAQSNLGAAYLQLGNSKAATATLKRAAALDPKNPETLLNLAHALFQNKQPLEAANTFARVASLSPPNPDLFYDWAVSLHQAGKNQEAAKVLQRIPSAQRSDTVESLWGDVAESLGQFKDAADHMQAAAKLNPSEPNLYALTIELLRHWTWQPATEVAQYGVERYPSSRRLKLAKGAAFYGGGHYTKAAEVFASLLAVDPDNEDYGSLLGRSCSSLGGDNAPQCAILISFADKHPGNAQIAVFAATNILHRPSSAAELDHAQRLLDQAIRVDPKIPEAYYQLGVLQQQRLQWSQSVVSLSKAIELRPAYAEAHYRLARAYSHTGHADLAAKEVALQQKYSQQEKDDTNARLQEVTRFLIGSH